MREEEEEEEEEEEGEEARIGTTSSGSRWTGRMSSGSRG